MLSDRLGLLIHSASGGAKSERFCGCRCIETFKCLTWSQFSSHRHSSVNQSVLTQVFSNLVVFWVITTSEIVTSDFLQRLQHQSADPNADVRGNHVHQSESSQNFEAMDVQLKLYENRETTRQNLQQTYSRVHEDEVHLHESEDHLQQWVDTAKNLVTWRSKWNLEERSELQSNVNQRAQTESCKQRSRLTISRSGGS